jgi:hypothetical protein
MHKACVHSLRAVKEFLLRDLSDESSKLEKDYFEMVFVIFVIGPPSSANNET